MNAFQGMVMKGLQVSEKEKGKRECGVQMDQMQQLPEPRNTRKESQGEEVDDLQGRQAYYHNKNSTSSWAAGAAI